MIVSIIGLGLIGGSIAKDLRNQVNQIYAVETNPEHRKTARELNLVDGFIDLDMAANISDIAIVCTPVGTIADIIEDLLNKSDNLIVTDAGSTKQQISDRINKHKNRRNYVGSHPMAGTEFSGPQAAMKNLFNEKICIICDNNLSSADALKKVENLWELLGMRFIYMNSEEHDEHAAYVSHMSHISSFVLALTVLEKEANMKNIFSMAGGGFESTVRLSKSSKEMWTPIFLQNKKYICDVIDTYQYYLTLFRKYINDSRTENINDLIEQSNKINNALKTPQQKELWKQQTP